METATQKTVQPGILVLRNVNGKTEVTTVPYNEIPVENQQPTKEKSIFDDDYYPSDHDWKAIYDELQESGKKTGYYLGK